MIRRQLKRKKGKDRWYEETEGREESGKDRLSEGKEGRGRRRWKEGL